MDRISLKDKENYNERRLFLSSHLGIALSAIGNTLLEEDNYQGHCENPIGAVQIPMGVVGPLQVKSPNLPAGEAGLKVKSYYIPLATTEGALVASVNRGCKAMTFSGGVKREVKDVGITRGPVFRVASISAGRKFQRWVKDNLEKISQIAGDTSSHLKLVNIDSRLVGKNVFFRFSFDTQDAMGMNMATIATQSTVKYIEKETGYDCIALAGNFDIDKKPAWLNSLLGRGKMVWAEAVIKKRIVKEVLRTTSKRISQTVYQKSLIGSALSGSIGFNAHYANIIAAIFAATGQDLAHVVEGSIGITTAEVEENGDLYFSVYLPCLVVGTMGGGTGLPTQREALSILGVAGGDEGRNARRFAGIIGAAVLAGELSLTASLAEGSLAKTHQRFRKMQDEHESY